MSETAAIRVEHLAKQYQLGGQQAAYQTFRDAIVEGVKAPIRWLRGQRREPNLFWALDDVSFEIKHGEAVGIIGRNGAGKSTLLKILSSITTPTRGRVDLYGRVGSLLEVGTGFHPELTGRENIFLNGAILGMSRKEIIRKFDEIVDFAEVEKFLDTPVKHYSSGMYVRLAFAVAAHLEPEILVVDEVLAVGDAEFQKKSLGKMGDVAKGGRTVLFVSHNMSAIQDLCQTAHWLDQGKLVQSGPAKAMVAAYLGKQTHELSERVWEDLETAPGNENIRMVSARVSAAPGYDSSHLTVETPLVLTFRVFNYRPDLPIHFNFQLYNQQRVCVFNTASSRQKFPAGIVEGRCQIPANLLNDNVYSVTFMAHFMVTPGVGVEEALGFEVHDAGREGINWYGEWVGAVRPRLDWEMQGLGEQA